MNRVSEESDRRKTVISLTDVGRDLVSQCRSEVDALRDVSWNNLSDEDYSDFNRILDQIFANFEGYD